ncbi:hypothetical protein CCP2SC5_1050004 [Azospirillaceae bacterium]
MTDQTMDALRQDVVRLLPEVMDRAISSYRKFSVCDIPLEAKEFKDHHQAGRVALAHLEGILRLARWATDSVEEISSAPDDDPEMNAMILEAQTALQVLRKK